MTITPEKILVFLQDIMEDSGSVIAAMKPTVFFYSYEIDNSKEALSYKRLLLHEVSLDFWSAFIHAAYDNIRDEFDHFFVAAVVSSPNYVNSDEEMLLVTTYESNFYTLNTFLASLECNVLERDIDIPKFLISSYKESFEIH